MTGETGASDLKRATAVTVVIHSILPVCFLALLLLIVPRFQQMFADSDVALPLMTLLLLSASDFVKTHWYLAPFLIAIPRIVDGTVYYGLRRAGGRWLSLAWSGAVLILQIMVVVLALLALYLPHMAIMARMR